MALKFEIIEGNLKITNTEYNSVVVLFSKQNIGIIANIILNSTSPVILYNIPKGFSETIFTSTLNQCVDSANSPFTPETFIEFCELNLGFNSPEASGTITVEDSYLTLPPANTQMGKFYWCQNSQGIYLTGLYYSNGTTWETSEADEIKVVANYSALPDPTTVPGQYYWCEASQGTSWLPGSLGGTYYNSGMYYSNGTTWEFLNVPYNAPQAIVDAGLNNEQFVTPNTLSNYSKWDSKVDTTFWIDYSSFSTITGFSSLSDFYVFYKIADGKLDCFCYFSGVSNALNITFTLPYVSAFSFTQYAAGGINRNGGVQQTVPPRLSISPGSNVVIINKDLTAGNYTTSNIKTAGGSISFKI